MAKDNIIARLSYMNTSTNFINAGVIGHPVNHSKSPMIHNHWIGQYGLKGQYKAIDVAPENLERDVMALIGQGYKGFSVTIPHKQTIMSLCDEVEDVAKAIGAVNTLYLRDYKIFGTNTDAFGFIANLKTQEKFFQKDKPVLILGAGGASRAIVYGLLQEGFEKIIITNRTMDKANELVLVNPSKIESLAWENNIKPLKDIGLLVNTTSLGMVGKDSLNLNLHELSPNTIVTDIVYAPLMTPLLMQAKSKGCPIVTGIGMLLHQARPAFQKWFGVMPDIDETLLNKVLA